MNNYEYTKRCIFGNIPLDIEEMRSAQTSVLRNLILKGIRAHAERGLKPEDMKEWESAFEAARRQLRA